MHSARKKAINDKNYFIFTIRLLVADPGFLDVTVIFSAKKNCKVHLIDFFTCAQNWQQKCIPVGCVPPAHYRRGGGRSP